MNSATGVALPAPNPAVPIDQMCFTRRIDAPSCAMARAKFVVGASDTISSSPGYCRAHRQMKSAAGSVCGSGTSGISPQPPIPSGPYTLSNRSGARTSGVSAPG